MFSSHNFGQSILAQEPTQLTLPVTVFCLLCLVPRYAQPASSGSTWTTRTPGLKGHRKLKFVSDRATGASAAVSGGGTTGGAASSDGSVMVTTGTAQVSSMGTFGSTSSGTGSSSRPDGTTTSGDAAGGSSGATAGAVETSTPVGTTSFDIESEATGSGNFEVDSTGSTGAGSGSVAVSSVGTGDGVDTGSSTATAEGIGGGRGDDSEVASSESVTIQGFNTDGRASFSDRVSSRTNNTFANRAGINRLNRPTRASRISATP